jgi:hypothetical protein
MSAEAFPLQWPDGWPRTSLYKRGSSRFGKNLGLGEIKKLQAELRLLGGRNVVISSNIPLRNDGLPYASQAGKRYDDPGVAIYFRLKDKPLSMARDRYVTPWENIRSLTLTINAIRSIERHGGSTMMERAFSGFAAIAPPDWKKPWREVFGVKPEWRGDIAALYKEKARNRHPDVGGDDMLMAELNVAYQEAKRELGEHAHE